MSKRKPSNLVDFPCPEPGAVESRAPKKKKGKENRQNGVSVRPRVTDNPILGVVTH